MENENQKNNKKIIILIVGLFTILVVATIVIVMAMNNKETKDRVKTKIVSERYTITEQNGRIIASWTETHVVEAND